VKDAFDAMLREFRGTGPVKKVPFGANPKTGLSGHLAEATLGISGEVVIQNVVIRPEAHEGWHGDNRGTIGTEKVEYLLERIDWITKMLQDIQHQDQGIAFSRLKTRVEGTDMDTGAMGLPSLTSSALGSTPSTLPNSASRSKKRPSPQPMSRMSR
jgi:hypothetical protein